MYTLNNINKVSIKTEIQPKSIKQYESTEKQIKQIWEFHTHKSGSNFMGDRKSGQKVSLYKMSEATVSHIAGGRTFLKTGETAEHACPPDDRSELEGLHRGRWSFRQPDPKLFRVLTWLAADWQPMSLPWHRCNM